MSHSWDEVQELLDDPYVDGDTKEHLLGAYLNENYGFTLDDVPDEVRGYLDEYSMEGGDFDQGSLDDVFGRAQDESDRRGYQYRQVQDDVDAARSELSDMAPPETSGSGVATSDEIFEPVRPALRVFKTWLPINDQVPEGLLGHHGRISLDDVTTRFDEQKGISFRKFLEDADRMRQAHTALGDLNTTAGQQLSSVYQSWTGPAANASYDHYSQRIAPNVSSLLEALSTGADGIEAAVRNVFEACKDKADQVAELYTPLVGEAPPYIARRMVKLARGDEVSHGEAKSVASWIDRQTGGGSELENGMNNGIWELMLPELARFSGEWIRDCFNPDLHDRIYETFDRACTDTAQRINTTYEELNAALGEYDNGFADSGAQQVTGPAVGTTATGSAIPGLDGGGSASGGGGAGSGGGAAAQPPPAVDIPSPSDIPSLAGAGSSAGDPAGTQPSGLEPESPEPGDSLSPQPIRPDTGQPETVTIADGDRTISVSSPDGQGRVTITIDDGGAEPKTYEIDFGDETGTGAGQAQPGEPGAVPLPAPAAGAAPLPGTGPLPDLPPAAIGPDLPPPRYGGPGPGPMPDFGPLPDLPPPPTVAASAVAGPDGVATIEDGGTTITAERPAGSPDRVMVTVDSGSGDPTTYTVDYSDPANPTVASGSAGAGGQAGSFGLPGQGEYTAATDPGGGSSGEAALAATSDDAGRPSGTGGMPMLGGMGGAPGGGDQERSAGQWRLVGDLFDEDRPEARFRGAIEGNR
jgi:uncharacterized protein YukE